MIVSHDAAEAVRAVLQRFEERGTVGVEQLNAAVQQAHTLGDQLRVAAGVLDEAEAAGFRHRLQHLRRKQALIGAGTLVHAEGHVRNRVQNPVHVGNQHVVALVLRGKASGFLSVPK